MEFKFYCDERKIRYNDMASFIKSQYAVSESLKDDTIEKIDQYKKTSCRFKTNSSSTRNRIHRKRKTNFYIFGM